MEYEKLKPSSFPKEWIEEFINYLAEGDSQNRAIKKLKENFPNIQCPTGMTFYRWRINDIEGFRDLYDTARECGMEARLDQNDDLARDYSRDNVLDENGEQRFDKLGRLVNDETKLARDKEIIRNGMWNHARMHKYKSDKNGVSGGVITIKMDDSELKA